MTFAITPLILIALMILSTTASANGDETQPGLNPVELPPNFSMRRGDWPHSTPLLRTHWQSEPAPIATRQTIKDWFGWKNVNYMFSFGDSYTSTNFTTFGEQPNPSNPLGNPPFPGATSANGPNYVDFLTTTYNQSYIQTYNLGYGGATVNPFLVPTAFGAPVQTFLSQVEKEFLPLYTKNPEVPWNSSDTLFTIFFGINDVFQSYSEQNDSLNYDIIKSYEGLVNELYAAGGRNFLFMNVPPIDRAPISNGLSDFARGMEAAYIGAFNFRLGALVYNLSRRHPDTTVFSFDTNFLFTIVLDNPDQFPETAGYLNTTNYCPAYMEYVFSNYYNNSVTLQSELTFISGTPTLTYFEPSCGIPVNEYLWLNTLHPTHPMHNFMASQIVRLLGG